MLAEILPDVRHYVVSESPPHITEVGSSMYETEHLKFRSNAVLLTEKLRDRILNHVPT